MSVVGVRRKHVYVAGSISPWVEAIALADGAELVVTTDYTRNTPVL
jgi:predicted nicotinamide N-methyase